MGIAGRKADPFCYASLSVRRHIPSSELLALVRSGHVLLMLVDHRFLHCFGCSSAEEIAVREAEQEFSGHFILVTGLDPGQPAAAAAMSGDAAAALAESETMLQYLDPSSRHAPCSLTLASLDRARLSAGTDEDVLILSLAAHAGIVPQLSSKSIDRPAIGVED